MSNHLEGMALKDFLYVNYVTFACRSWKIYLRYTWWSFNSVCWCPDIFSGRN